MAKLIPDELGINLDKAYEKEPKIKELLKVTRKLQGVWKFAKA